MYTYNILDLVLKGKVLRYQGANVVSLLFFFKRLKYYNTFE